ncbi:unnamed protein product [Oikopleura dioica]|uniref:Uncharacterized protein n=1 Tax=Oikopleura dioica TaxID=34765 RepID=E4YZG9_OIKDI|nr:unnamed protein product [Oikopleura dioica]
MSAVAPVNPKPFLLN